MKADVRHSRKYVMDKIKGLKGKISEDDARRLTKEVFCVLIFIQLLVEFVCDYLGRCYN